ncbi:hypothetical protein [Rhizobium sp.]
MLHHDRDEIDALLARHKPNVPRHLDASCAWMALLAMLFAASVILAICATLLKG